MKTGLAVGGIGQGMMQGLELYRRHQSEDENAELRREQMDMQRESHGLNMETGRMNLDFARETNPLRKQGMEQNVELTGMQIDDTRHAMPYNQRHRERQDELGGIQLDQAQQQQAAHIASNSLRMGDLNGFNAAFDRLYPGRFIFSQGEDGKIYGEETNDEGESEIFVFDRDELLKNVTMIGNPQASAQNAMDTDTWVTEEHPNLGTVQRHKVTGEIKPFKTGKESGSAHYGGMKAADWNSLDKRNTAFFGKLDENGQIILDGDAKFNKDKANTRAVDLINAGLPAWQAEIVARASVGGMVDGGKAMAAAEQAAIDQKLKPGKPEYTAFIDNYMAQNDATGQQEAEEIYRQYVGSDMGAMGLRTRQSAPQTTSQTSSAPQAAIEYLRQNNTPEMRQLFKDKYGSLPENL